MTEGTTQEARRHVAHITTNLKRNTDHDMSAKVLLIGENGAGKSGLVDAFSLVTTGLGRSRGVGKGKELAAYGGWDGNQVEVEAELSNGQVLSWPSSTSFEGEDVSVRAIDALYGTPRSLQSLILSRFTLDGIGDQTDAQDVWSLLEEKVTPHVPNALKETLNGLLALAQNGTKASDLPGALARLSTVITQNSRNISSEIKRFENVTMVVSLSGDEEERVDKLTELRALVENFDVQGELELLSSQAARLDVELEALKVDIVQSQEAASQESERIIPQRRRLDLLSTVVPTINAYLAYFNGKPEDWTFPCPIDGSQVSMKALRARGELLDQAITELNDLLKVHDVLERTIVDKQRSLSISTQRLEGYQARIKQLKGAWTRDGTHTPADLDEELNRLCEQRSLADHYVASCEKITDLTKRKQELTALSQAAQKTSAAETSNVLDIATARVNRLLPPRIRVRIEKVGAMGAGCSLETKVDENRWVPYRLLGGAERALVSAAVASAFGSTGGASIDSLIIDDVWLSRPSTTTLISLIDQALAEPYGPSQAILSVVEYQGRVPDDWTVIKLDKGDTRDGATAETVPPAPVTSTADDPDDVPINNPFGVLFGRDQTPDEPAQDTLPIPPVPPELPEGLEYMGMFERDTGQKVPVYWMGHFTRFTSRSRQVLGKLPVELRTNGTLGIATSGAKSTLKSTVLYDGVTTEIKPSHKEQQRFVAMITKMNGL